MKYDLEERTAIFSTKVLLLCRKAKRDAISLPVITQLVRSATSVGANYAEANGASSRKDFKNKIHICKKEAQETKYWLRMLLQIEHLLKEEIQPLQQEAQELTLIFNKITTTMNNAKN